jgi:outer membrane immunogenic protein
MKKLLAGIVLTALVATPVMAADMPIKAPPVAKAAIANWTGFYLGGHLGAGWGTKNWDLTDVDLAATGAFSNFFDSPFSNGHLPTSFGIDGFLGGGQAGYRLQTGAWVFGVEATISGANIKGSNECFDLVCSSKVDWLVTLTGQVGWAVHHALLYIKGGAAWVHEKHSLDWPTCQPSVICTGSSLTTTRIGWLFGTGIAYAFDPRWSAFVEYNYMDFGSRQAVLVVSEVGVGAVVGSFVETRTIDINQKLHVIKAGVNYRF